MSGIEQLRHEKNARCWANIRCASPEFFTNAEIAGQPMDQELNIVVELELRMLRDEKKSRNETSC